MDATARRDLETVEREFSTLGQTGLLPLWGRYRWHLREDLPLTDPFAERLVLETKYDFAPIERHIGGYGVALWGHRSYRLDQVSRDYFRHHPDGFVANLGVGLDDPFQRVVPESGTMIDCDFPDVLAYRAKFLESHERRLVFSESMFEQQWMQPIQQAGYEDVQICMAGVTMYLHTHQMRDLLRLLSREFKRPRIAFDCLSPRGIKYLNRGMRKSVLPQQEVHWGLSGERELREWIGPNFDIRVSSIFEGLQRNRFDLMTRMNIWGAELVNLAMFVEISPKP